MFALTTTRHASLSPGALRIAFGAIALVTALIAMACAAFGAWLVLPFAGAELAGLWLAFDWIRRRAGDYERIEIVGDRLVVESCAAGRVCRSEFDRHWAQVVMSGTLQACRVVVRSHGREVELGRMMSAQARRDAALVLRRQLGDSR